jgi:hypothetical protein
MCVCTRKYAHILRTDTHAHINGTVRRITNTHINNIDSSRKRTEKHWIMLIDFGSVI